MADIQLRFNKDMLVLSSPIQTQLARLGVDAARDNELSLLLEPEIFEEPYKLENAAGAQCLVADTESLTPARLAHARLEDRGRELAEAALSIVNAHQPQHVLVELGPCGLPLDPTSKASLNEHRDQYVRAARNFLGLETLFDGFFLNGFTDCTELKCALMGLRKVTDAPILASIDLDDFGNAGHPNAQSLDDAVSIMAEYGAQAAGFCTSSDPATAARYVQRMNELAPAMPKLVQLNVRNINPEQGAATPDNPYYEADTMVDAADMLKEAGIQFLRAVGKATPSYTGALVAATLGDGVLVQNAAASQNSATLGSATSPQTDDIATDAELDELAAKLRQRIQSALGE